MDFNLADVNTAAGLLVVGVLIRYLVEIIKTLFAWVDAGREKFVVVGLAVFIYGAWYVQYGTGHIADAFFVAVLCAANVILTAFGVNTAVDLANKAIVSGGRTALAAEQQTVLIPVPIATETVPEPPVPAPTPIDQSTQGDPTNG